ncbi:helix-turn-helix transcriptional regulator [Herbiconiux sp. CPCC 203407]|uniref:Helix-turn-helix transcriptional regulator n=1 Tax=Herbiconiux oxytropis TaxID=2970915 RepID=A0AA42BWC3_9MICO|nr:helix-turn-helix transcriptional regulator [Herbiconiux oxytropis]MCS5723778.1 helix-turn-helix transcriptional regulator [Herbiconiux oxytropis]MCS5725873.1 helix-turn-helix transcriptional regulator [Herbiconiux oxytropis]
MTSRTPLLAQFLRSRRARLDPASFGFPPDDRRVPGLRREEVAELAGISRDYYTRLEQGQGHQMSDQVLNSLADALRLDGSERIYLNRIARAATTTPGRPSEPVPVSDQVLTLLKNWSHVPAYIFDSNQDVLAINEMADILSPGYATYGDNILLGAFAVLRDYPDVEIYPESARSTVAALRFHGDPANPRFREIVGQLSVSDPLFRRFWSEHDARPLTEGTTMISVEGSEMVEFPWQILEVPGGFFMALWPVEEGTRADELLSHLRHNRLTGRGIRGPLRGWPAV